MPSIFRGIDKWPKSRGFGSRIRRFESCYPYHLLGAWLNREEHLSHKQEVPGSNPGVPTILPGE